MRNNSIRGCLKASTIMGGAILLAVTSAPVFAQTNSDSASSASVETVVVTGSRIRRSASDISTAVPVDVISADTLNERGFVQAGDALNRVTSMTQSTPITPHNGTSSGSGQQFPNLFNLGPQRTLTLVNGRRFVSSGTGLGDNTVDTNMIPVGLLKRVDVVMGGGSVVYGSGGISGVVNYVLKDHFTGVQFDAQTGVSDRGDDNTNSFRVTAGTDFLGGRGNIAADFEYSKSDPLLQSQRLDVPQVAYTAADSSPPGSTTSVIGLLNSRFWEFSKNGVLFVNPPGTLTPTGYQAAFGGAFLVTNTGYHYGAPGAIPQQFAADGSGLINYDVGTNPPNGSTPLNIPFSSGGDGFRYSDLGSLLTGVERYNANIIGHVMVTPDIKLSTELFYGHTRGVDPRAQFGSNSNTVLNNQQSGAGAIVVKASNPYLPASAKATIANYLNTVFGGLGYAWLGGAPIPGFAVDLSKAWNDLLPSYASTVDTNTERGLIAAEGTLHFVGNDYYWSVSASLGHSESTTSSYDEIVSHFNNAVDAVYNGTGDIVCAINQVSVVDPACVPLNPFTQNLPTSSAAAIRSYVTGLFGQKQFNTQQDYLATISGPVIALPGGVSQFSATYEHRGERASFRPMENTKLGLGPAGAPTPPASGEYNTNEVALEFLAPIIGPEQKLWGVNAFQLHAAYRFVSNSISGDENVWNVGARWTVVPGLTLRGSRSRNFRAPTLLQLFQPASTSLAAVGRDPCDSRYINAGPGGSVNRVANCTAEWAAHPGYTPLGSFTDLASNFSTAAVTTHGNAQLKDELSDVWTYGVVIQPQIIPGLSFTADRIEIKLSNALTAVAPSDVLNACYDNSPAAFAANPLCTGSMWTRNASGQIVAAQQTYLNAAFFEYKGETYNLAYHFELADLLGEDRDMGLVDMNLQATRSEKNVTAILNGSKVNLAGTAQSTTNAFGDPRWVTRFDLGYTIDALHLTYELFYLPATRVNPTATIANTPYPNVSANVQHSISVQYNLSDNWSVRAGITNLTDEKPSYPLVNYGDIIGRRYFFGMDVRY